MTDTRSVFKEPQCLFSTDSETRLTINMDVMDQIATVEKQLNVVAIAGFLRTGKSYLLTRLAGKDIYKGFPLGYTIQSGTKGIWAWCVDHPKDSSQKLLLLDTEGLGDTEKSDVNHDNQLFSLVILLSSTLIYNMMGILTEHTIEKLNFITEMAKHIKTSGKKEGETQFDVYFPGFILTMRDFTLRLEADGKPITPDEYLDRTLQMKPTNAGELKTKRNDIRQCLINFFRDRKCFVFCAPGGGKITRALETLTDDDLDEEFVAQTRLLIDHVYGCCRPMALRRGNPVNGRMFKSLAVCYVETIRNGAVPCVENALESMKIIENEKAVENALQLYTDMMSDLQIPVSDEKALNDFHKNCHGYASDKFFDKCVLDDQLVYKRKLEDKIRDTYNGIVRTHSDDSERKCGKLLKQLHDKLIQPKIANKVYARERGFPIYKTDMKKLAATYKETRNLGLKKEEVFTLFRHGIQNESTSIMNADKEIGKINRDIILEKEKTANAKLRADNSKKCLEIAETKRNNAQNEHKRGVAVLKAKNDKETATLKKNIKKLEDQRKEDARKFATSYSEQDYENRLMQLQIKQFGSNLNSYVTQMNSGIHRGYIYDINIAQEKNNEGSMIAAFLAVATPMTIAAGPFVGIGCGIAAGILTGIAEFFMD